MKQNKNDTYESLLSTPLSEESIESADHDRLRLYIEQEEYLSQKQDREQRKEFANKIFTFVKYYLLIVLVMLFLNGIPFPFHLSDTVFVTLLGTTTANIVGLFAFVAKYLFQPKKK